MLAERAAEFQKAYHEAGEKMKELIGEPGFAPEVGAEGVGTLCAGKLGSGCRWQHTARPAPSASRRLLLLHCTSPTAAAERGQEGGR